MFVTLRLLLILLVPKILTQNLAFLIGPLPKIGTLQAGASEF